MQLFPSANAMFNPSRFAAESGQSPDQVPGSSVMPAGSAVAQYLPILVAVLILWFLEKRRIKAAAK